MIAVLLFGLMCAAIAAAMYGVNALFEWDAQRKHDARQAEPPEPAPFHWQGEISDSPAPPQLRRTPRPKRQDGAA